MIVDSKKKRPKVPAKEWVELKSIINKQEGIEFTNAELLDKLLEIVKEYYNIDWLRNKVKNPPVKVVFGILQDGI